MRALIADTDNHIHLLSVVFNNRYHQKKKSEQHALDAEPLRPSQFQLRVYTKYLEPSLLSTQTL